MSVKTKDFDCRKSEEIKLSLELSGLDLITIYNALNMYMSEIRFHTCPHCKKQGKDLFEIVTKVLSEKVLSKDGVLT